MALTRKLSRFAVQATGDTFSLQIEDETGEMFEFEATPEQVDLIADALDELLNEDNLDEFED